MRPVADTSMVSVSDIAAELRIGREKVSEIVRGLPTFAGGRGPLYQWGDVRRRALGLEAPETAAPPAPMYRGRRAKL